MLEALSDEQKELLEKFCATEIELNGISEREAFTAGFRIAMRLAAEAFYERTTNKRMAAEITPRSAVSLSKFIARLRLKNGKIYGIIRYR